MKKIIAAAMLVSLCCRLNAQSDKKASLWETIQISESLETADRKEKPAQFQITLPKDAAASWLVNMGVASKFYTSSDGTHVSKALVEYHKNTLTNKEQHNFQLGYGLMQLLTDDPTRGLYVNADVKYAYDAVNIKNAFASTALLSWYRDGEQGLNLNTFRRYSESRQAVLLSAYGGLQTQGVFDAKDKAALGFIVRPLYILGVQYELTKATNLYLPVARLTLDYTGRVDAINTSAYREHYTHFFKAAADVFIVYDPVKISVGGSFNYGSDPLRGLAQQQFWLISLNISK